MPEAPFSAEFPANVYRDKYAWEGEDWFQTAHRVVNAEFGSLYYTPGARASAHVSAGIADHAHRIGARVGAREFIPGGRHLYGAGRDFHQVNNCFLTRVGDSREEWAAQAHKALMVLQSGGGLGSDYSAVRGAGALIRRTGGIASGPIPLAIAINDLGRAAVSGGNRRAALWAGLKWSHPDIEAWIVAKDWPQYIKDAKAKDFTVPADLDMTNISVQLDDHFFEAYGDPRHPDHARAHKVFRTALERALIDGEPGFSVDLGADWEETLRNPCCEITSADDSDVCNLGHANLAAFNHIDDFAPVVRDGTHFLLAGSLYSEVPYQKVHDVREQNRRLGLGLMGMHAWLLDRGRPYGPDEELGVWLEAYAESERYANEWADAYGVSRPIKTRAIAPTGTTSILGETTAGIEPILFAAFKRRLRHFGAGSERSTWEYVVDPTAARALARGVDPELVEDARTLSYDVGRRLEFQAWVQQYVDHAISSTVNLPGPITDPREVDKYEQVAMKYLPRLRGLTFYPDGARAGQPIVPVPLEEAIDAVGVRYEELSDDRCVNGVCAV